MIGVFGFDTKQALPQLKEYVEKTAKADKKFCLLWPFIRGRLVIEYMIAVLNGDATTAALAELIIKLGDGVFMQECLPHP